MSNTTITFAVLCLACGKREEGTIDYDMAAGSDEDLKDKQEFEIAVSGEWLHVPTITEKDVHLCAECVCKIEEAEDNHMAWWTYAGEALAMERLKAWQEKERVEGNEAEKPVADEDSQ